MADASAFYQGSQTGGILQNINPLPPGGGAAAQGSLDAAIKAAQPYGSVAVYKAVAAYNSGNSYNPATGVSTPLSSYPSQPVGGTSGTPPSASGTGMTTIGQGDAWLSPDEMRARTNALQGHAGTSSGGSSGGGSGGGSGISPSSAGTGGLNLSGGSTPVGSTPGSLQQTSTPIGSTLGYQNPGSVNMSNTAGYAGTGNNAGQGQAGVLQMQQANPQSALDAYKSTPGYQLLNSPGSYQQSPGYQYAMDQAMNQVQSGASAKGMLESGSVIKSMQQTASGLAQQDYGNWWNRQNQLYGDYQNRLQGLAGGPTGSADAMTAGANSAQANLQTGSNLGSLFGNQGTSGMGGIINTAAAQSGNMINAGQQQATVNAANQATQLAGATMASNKGLF